MSLFGRLVGTGVGGYVQEVYGATFLYRGAALLVIVTLILQLLVITLDKDEGSTLIAAESNPDVGARRANHSERAARSASAIARRVLSGKSKKQNRKWAPLSQNADNDNESVSEIEFTRNSGIVFI